jgi:putative RNA 2'-phosphotransferase
MNEHQTQKISKFLSLVLRHQPESLGITLDPQGWTDVKTLVAKMRSKFPGIDKATLDDVVENNNKKRFSYNKDQTMIRASQGHSVTVELDYAPTLPPETLYHGTVPRFLEAIRKDGLLKMSRHQVHLSRDIDTAAGVGSRRGEAVILKVKAGEMHRDGFDFFVSENGVWLTDMVPPSYILFP